MWIAKDKSGIIHLFSIKPSRIIIPKGMWQYENTWFINLTEGYEMCIDNALFSDLKWEDEPIEVKLVSKSIDEDNLAKLANQYILDTFQSPWEDEELHTYKTRARCAFKAGYRRAMEEQQ